MNREPFEISYVVRDHSGRVVVVFSGTDAPEAASEWAGRGYDVTPTVLDDQEGATAQAV